MKRSTVFTISLLMCTLLAVTPAAAAQTKPKNPSEINKSEAELNGYSEEAWRSLTDNRLEFGEIKELVHNFNPTMAEYWDSFDDSLRSVENSAQIMREANKDAKDNYNQFRNSPYYDPISGAQLKAMVTLTSTMLKQYNQTYKKLASGGSAAKQLETADNQMTKAIQQIMIAYKTIEGNVRILKQLVDMNEAAVRAYTQMKAEGMATDTDVLKAQADLISAKSNLASLEAARKQLYGQLITMCGWKADDKVVIGDIPEAEAARIEAMDPDADFHKAEGNNSTLISLRQEGRNKNAGALSAQDEYYDAKVGELRVQLDTLYAAVIGARYAYEGAKAGYEGAKIQEAAVKKQYESGMLSEAQHIGAQIQVLQKQAALETARNNLQKAVLDYEWAVKGYSELK